MVEKKSKIKAVAAVAVEYGLSVELRNDAFPLNQSVLTILSHKLSRSSGGRSLSVRAFAITDFMINSLFVMNKL